MSEFVSNSMVFVARIAPSDSKKKIAFQTHERTSAATESKRIVVATCLRGPNEFGFGFVAPEQKAFEGGFALLIFADLDRKLLFERYFESIADLPKESDMYHVRCDLSRYNRFLFYIEMRRRCSNTFIRDVLPICRADEKGGDSTLLAMYEKPKETFSDLVFHCKVGECGWMTYNAHRCVLALVSPYFATLLNKPEPSASSSTLPDTCLMCHTSSASSCLSSSSFTPRSSPSCVKCDVACKYNSSIDAVLRYAYGLRAGLEQMTPAELCDLLVACDHFSLNALFDDCVAHMIVRLKDDEDEGAFLYFKTIVSFKARKCIHAAELKYKCTGVLLTAIDDDEIDCEDAATEKALLVLAEHVDKNQKKKMEKK